MNRKKVSKILIGIAIVLIIVSLIYGIKKKKNEEKPINIEKFVIPSKNYVFINGVVKPESIRVYESNPAKGELDSINISNEQKVEAGQILMSYKNQEAINQVEEIGYDIQNLLTADANEREARKKQIKKLETQRANLIQEAKAAGQPIPYSQLPSTELETPPTDYSSQIQKLERQREALRSKSYEKDITDISGIAKVEKIFGSQGNQTRITVRSTNYIIEGTVKEKDLDKISEGMAGKSKFISNNKTYDSKIEKIDRSTFTESSNIASLPTSNNIPNQSGNTENSSSEYKVRIKLNTNESLTEGFHVQTKVNIDKDPRIKIPKTALISEKGKKYVYLINEDNILKKKEIEVEAIDGEEAILNSGLKENEAIVKKPNENLKEGDKIE